MTTAPSAQRRLLPGAGFALSVVATLAGLVLPPLPLLRRGAWCLGLVVAVLWLVALYIFFARFAGPGFLAHIGLWFVAFVGMCVPRRLARMEARVREIF